MKFIKLEKYLLMMIFNFHISPIGCVHLDIDYCGDDTYKNCDVDSQDDHVIRPKDFDFDFAVKTEDDDWIVSKRNELITRGILHISNFMSVDGIIGLKHIASSNFENDCMSLKSGVIIGHTFDHDIPHIGDNGIPQTQSRIFCFCNSNQTAYGEYLEDMYHYKPLRDMLNKILDIGSAIEDSSDLKYRSYLLGHRGDPWQDGTAWHYDDHDFSCGITINQTQSGGAFRYVQYRNLTTIHRSIGIPNGDLELPPRYVRYSNNDDFWNDDRLIQLLKGDKFHNSDDTITNDMNDHIYSIKPNEGDLYCFLGNESLHSVEKVESNDTRVSLIIAFTFDSHFGHSAHALDNYGWD